MEYIDHVLQHIWMWPLAAATPAILFAALALFLSVYEIGRKLMIVSWLLAMGVNLDLMTGLVGVPTWAASGLVVASVSCGAVGLVLGCRLEHDRHCTDRRHRSAWRYHGVERRGIDGRE